MLAGRAAATATKARKVGFTGTFFSLASILAAVSTVKI
jgi:hypothetical protein